MVKMEEVCFIFELGEERGTLAKRLNGKEWLSNGDLSVHDEVCGRRRNALSVLFNRLKIYFQCWQRRSSWTPKPWILTLNTYQTLRGLWLIVGTASLALFEVELKGLPFSDESSSLRVASSLNLQKHRGGQLNISMGLYEGIVDLWHKNHLVNLWRCMRQPQRFWFYRPGVAPRNLHLEVPLRSIGM